MNSEAPRDVRKIALVTSGFTSGGGVTTLVQWLLDTLRSIGGYTVDVHDLATSSRDESSRRLLKPASWVRRSVRTMLTGENLVVHWGANAVEIEVMRYRPRSELTRALQGYDIVQVVSGSPALAAVVVPAGVPTALWVGTTVAWERQQAMVEMIAPMRMWRQRMTILTTRLEHHALRSADAVLVQNSTLLDYVGSLRKRSIVNARPGIDASTFSPAASGWQRQGHLLSVCRLNEPRKGLDRMIYAYHHLVRRTDSVPMLVLAGIGHLPQRLIHLLKDLRLLSRVRIVPNVGPTELPELYRGASVFLQTSHEEGFGMSVLEAMACGLPVVCTTTAGSQETVVDGKTGWLLPQCAGDDLPRLMADRVLDILRGDGAAMGARGRDRCVTAFSSDVTIRRFTDTYDEILLRHYHGSRT